MTNNLNPHFLSSRGLLSGSVSRGGKRWGFFIMRRNFTRREKMAAQIFQGIEGEADHIVPYSKGGATEISNLQILPRHMNRAKSAFKFEPRKWQERFLIDYRKPRESESFLLIAIPGSGKTYASLEAARIWLRKASDHCLMIVVPSDNLRSQWAKEALNFGMQLQTDEFGLNFKHSFQGGITTYQSVSSDPTKFKVLTSRRPTMVIFDEIHHAADSAAFGKGITEAFCYTKEKLCMSGTPWNSNGKISFLNYNENGFVVPDCVYDYPNALKDDVVRYLVFDYGKGKLTDIESGDIHELDKDTKKHDASWRLNQLLKPEGDFVKKLLIASDSKLNEIRTYIPDAAGLVICIDQMHAFRVAKVLESISGEKPSLIISDTTKENDTVERFRNCNKKWIVSVKKVSEGTDIKRLQVLSYLTNCTTELFFRQAVGRVCRVRKLEDFEGYVFLPADPRLIELAKNIESLQVHALKEEAEEDDSENKEKTESTESGPSLVMFETDHSGTDVLYIGGRSIDSVSAEKLKSISESTGVAINKVLEIMEMTGSKFNVAIPETSSVTHEEPLVSLEDELKKWRRLCNKKANRLAHVVNVEVRQIHSSYSAPQKEMTLAQLKSKFASLNKRIMEGLK
jgi:superfamily II DNA or RNA helicase